MRAVSGGFENAFQKRDDGAFAVRARDVNDRRQPILRVAKRIQQALDAAKRQVDQLRMKCLKAREQRLGFRWAQGLFRN